MLDLTFILSSVAYLTIAAILLSVAFRKLSKQKSLYLSAATLLVMFAVKLVSDAQNFPVNYYAEFGIARDAKTFDVRKAYKKVSLQYHPDKNTAFDSKEKFEKIKAMYDILIDEEKRDLYNRFGENFLLFDPRQDEIKLISSIATNYIFWAFVSYIMLLPKQCKLCGIWILIYLLIMLIVEVYICLSESTSAPILISIHMTEHEFLLSMHCLFPFVLCLLRILGEYLYVDLDLTIEEALNDVVKHEKAVQGILQQLLHDVTRVSDQADEVKLVQSKLMNLVTGIQGVDSSLDRHLTDLKSVNANPIANYYWLLFVAIYIIVAYFMQGE